MSSTHLTESFNTGFPPEQSRSGSMVTLRSPPNIILWSDSDYDDDFNDDDLEREPSLDDSGIGEDGTGNNEGSQNCNGNLSSEVLVLRKRITEIENENVQLKAQLKLANVLVRGSYHMLVC